MRIPLIKGKYGGNCFGWRHHATALPFSQSLRRRLSGRLPYIIIIRWRETCVISTAINACGDHLFVSLKAILIRATLASHCFRTLLICMPEGRVDCTLQWRHMGAMASQVTSLTIVYFTDYSGKDQRKYQSSAALVIVRGIQRWPVNSPHKWPVTQKMFPFDDVLMTPGATI